MPSISHIHVRLRGKRWYTKLDLQWGCWNIPLVKDSVKYTRFAVPGKGIYVSKVLSFGLKPSGTEFERAIEEVLGDLLVKGEVQVYIDDIIIATENDEQRLIT
eukprot:GHVN01011499.1.p1 GENE.GHVN01011499.1~~GHVN01011499.1.p1  ORF type:complete len:103 (+),score=5.62 GHVN01011499.1:1-309(+)